MSNKLREEVLNRPLSTLRTNCDVKNSPSSTTSSINTISLNMEDVAVIESNSEDIFDDLIDRNIRSQSTISNITIMTTPDKSTLTDKQSQVNAEGKKFCGRPFSLEEDEKILNFLKAEKTFLKIIYYKPIYQVMKEKCSFDRSWEELRSRLLGDIIPNLFTYKCLTLSDMVDVYNCINMELPEELQFAIYNTFTSKNIDLRNATKDFCTQKSKDINLFKMGKYIGFYLNKIVHLIVPKSDIDTYEQESELNLHVEKKNVHFIENNEYSIYSNLQQLDENFSTNLSQVVQSYLTKTEKQDALIGLPSYSSLHRNIDKYCKQPLSQSVSFGIGPRSIPSSPECPSQNSTEMYTCVATENDANKSQDSNKDTAPETNVNTQYFDCNTSNELNVFTSDECSQKIFLENVSKLTYNKKDTFSADETEASKSQDKIKEPKENEISSLTGIGITGRESYRDNLRFNHKRKRENEESDIEVNK